MGADIGHVAESEQPAEATDRAAATDLEEEIAREIKALEENHSRRMDAAMRLLIEAQNAVLQQDYSRVMTLTEQSLAQFETGQALALKGSIYYLTGNMQMAQQLWQQAHELVPEIKVPIIDGE